MKKALFLVVAMGAMLVSCCKQAPAVQEEKAEGKVNAGIAAIRVANDLAHYGYEVESPMALIEAADILISTPVRDMESVEIVRGEAEGEAVEKTEKQITPAQLLADAKEWAGEDANLLAIIANVEAKMAAAAEGTRGAVDGPYVHYDRIKGNTTDVYYLAFTADELAEVAVVGDGDTDFDLYVYDENENLLAKDVDYGDNCYVSFSPRWTGSFLIKIKNLGNMNNNYVLMTN